jgi:hypothetical protein
MKATLKFNLLDREDAVLHQHAIKAKDYIAALRRINEAVHSYSGEGSDQQIKAQVEHALDKYKIDLTL